MSVTSALRRQSVLPTLAALALLSAVAPGCASRAAPFDKLDQASVTIMKLQQKPQTGVLPGAGGFTLPGGIQIPGIDPALVQQTLQQLQQGGFIPPGLIPGMGGTNPTQPAQQPYANDPNFVIADQRPVVDEQLKSDLLDLFGDDASFNEQAGNCWFPGMVVSFQGSPDYPQPVDVAVSLSCNQAQGYGFQWPHANRGLTAESHQTLTGIYQSLFGPVPPQA
jgi:hypothetical protein